jgi:glucose/mannose-6-phosphate isomerase
MQNQIDKHNLRDIIKNIPDQLVQGLDLAKDVEVKGKFKAIEISGMGGSALPGNLLRIYLSQLFRQNPTGNHRFGIYQNRFYNLPHEAFDNCLNVVSSYSGNTEETVASFEEALENSLPCVGIAAGGKILEMCREKNIPFVKMPEGVQPRMMTATNFAAVFQLLVNSGMIEDRRKEFEETAQMLKKQGVEFEESGKKNAREVMGKTPVVYASTRYKSLAMIWKIMFNENAKTPAFWNFFPELNHNEMVGFTRSNAKFHLVVLRDSGDDPRNLKRFEKTVGILKDYGVGATVVDMPEDGTLFRIFATLQIGCWVSYYLALEYGIDPTPVEMVEELKEQLRD